jgi:hypothetical protein
MTDIYMIYCAEKTATIELPTGLNRPQTIEAILQKHPEAITARGITYRLEDGATLYDGPAWHLRQ